MTATIQRLAGQDFDFLGYFREALGGQISDASATGYTLTVDENGDGSSIVTLIVSGNGFDYDADGPTTGVISGFDLSLNSVFFGFVAIASGSGFAVDTSQPEFHSALLDAGQGNTESLYQLLVTGPLDQIGTNNNDNFELFGYGNTIDGGGNHDDLFLSPFVGVTIDQTTGQILDSGSALIATITSVEGINGTSGDDTFIGGGPNDHAWWIGYDGADTFAGSDDAGSPETVFYNIEGGNHGVIVNMSSAPLPADLDIGFGPYTVAPGTAIDTYGNVDTLSNIDNIEGTEFADYIVGDSGNNYLSGRAGNDFIDGGDGDDFIDGGDDADVLNGGGGFDFVFGGAGDDNIQGGDGDDVLTGGAGNDIIDGGTENGGGNHVSYISEETEGGTEGVIVNFSDTALVGIDIGDGAHDVAAHHAKDTFGDDDTLISMNEASGTSHADYIVGGDEDNAFVAYDGADTIIGNGGFDRINYGAEGGPNGIIVNLSDVALSTGNGDPADIAEHSAIDSFDNTDLLSGIESINGTSFDDIIVGDENDNALDGGDTGSDQIYGGGGNDFIDGGDDADFLDGGDGDDYVGGGAGDDTLVSGGGNNRLVGGAGNDTLVLGNGWTSLGYSEEQWQHPDFFGDHVWGTASGEFGIIINLSSAYQDASLLQSDIPIDGHFSTFVGFNPGTVQSGTAIDSFGNIDTFDLSGFSGNVGVDGTDAADLFIAGDGQNGLFIGFDGNDVFVNKGLDNNVGFVGGAGNDVFGGDSDHLDDPHFTVKINYRAEQFFGNHPENGSHNDVPVQGIYVDFLQGYAIDTFGDTDTFVDVGHFVVQGSDEDDVLIANDHGGGFQGHGGDDIVTGGAGDDEMVGGFGNDTLVGAGGIDSLIGGGGADTLIAGGGATVAADYGSEQWADRDFDGGHIWGTQPGEYGVIVNLSSADQDESLLQTDLQIGGDFSTFVGFSPASVLSSTAIDTFGDTDTLQFGAAGEIWIRGTDAADLLIGGDGMTGRLIGFDGDDVFVVKGLNSDMHLVGGAGNDVFGGDSDHLDDPSYVIHVDYWREQFTGNHSHEGAHNDLPVQGVHVDLLAGTATDTFGDTDTFVDVGRFIVDGSDQADVIIGNDHGGQIYGNDGDDVLTGGAGDDFIDGGAGNDTIAGGGGFDFVFGGTGDDNIQGGDGDDVLTGGAGNDIIDGGTENGGGNHVSYISEETEGGTEGVIVNFSDTALVGIDIGDGAHDVAAHHAKDTFGDDDTLISMNEASGTSHADYIVGGDEDNAFVAYDGADTIIGNGGFDRINYGAEGGPNGIIVNLSDVDLSIGNGDPADIAAHSAVDSFGNTDSLSSIESINGTSFDDIIVGDENDNALDGGDTGSDQIHGGGGSDFISGGDDADILDGGDGDDFLVGGDGDDILHGGAGSDVFDSGTGNDVLYADGGDDDWIFYEAMGHGVVIDLAMGIVDKGADGTDLLFGFSNVHASQFDDQVTMSDAGGYVFARAGNDILTGGAGDDLLIAGSGDDVVDGGAGFNGVDYFDDEADNAGFPNHGVIVNLSGGDIVANVDGVDRTIAAGHAYDNWGGDDTLTNIQSVSGSMHADYIVGDDSDNSLYGGGLGNDQIYGGGGNDFITGGDDGDVLDGGDGDDQLIAGSGDDVVDGGAGFNGVDYFDGVAVAAGFPDHGVIVNLSGGDITANVDGIDRTIAAGHAYDNWGDDDTLTNIQNVSGSMQADYIVGDDSDNNLYGGGLGSDQIYGGGGNDFITGGDDADFLDGGDGDDYVGGGAGDDTLVSGGGNNRLVGGAGNDTLVLGNGWTSLGYSEEQWQHPDFFGDHVWGTASGEFGIIINLSSAYQDASLLQSDIPIDGHFSTFVGFNPGTVQSGTAIDSFGNIDTFDLSGFSGNVGVDGTDAADLFIAGDGQNGLFIGFDGNDVFVNKGLDNNVGFVGGAGNDVFGGDSDHLDDPHFTVKINYRAEQFFGNHPENGSHNDVPVQGIYVDFLQGYAIDTFGDTDTFVDVGHFVVQGSDEDDVLIANDHGGGFQGHGGDDIVTGGAGDDEMVGGFGNDTLVGAGGIDSLIGGGGADTLIAGGGATVAADYGSEQWADRDFDGGHIWGTQPGEYGVIVNLSSADQDESLLQTDLQIGGDFSTFVGFSPASVLSSTAIDTFGDTDTLQFGAAGEIWIRGTDAADLLIGGDGMTGRLIGFDGDDVLVVKGLNSDMHLVGGAGNDVFGGDSDHLDDPSYVIHVDYWREQFTGNHSHEGAHNNLPVQGVHVDLLAGTATDTFGDTDTFVDVGRFIVDGSDQADVIIGNDHGGQIYGNDGDDTVVGGSSNDELFGDTGNDTVTHDGNDDVIDGGDGIDTLVVNTASSLTIDLSASADQSDGPGDTAVVTNFENVDASGSTAAVSLIGDAGDNVLIGGSAADTIAGGAGDDRLFGDTGNDTIAYDGNDDLIDGGDDIDTLVVNTASSLTIDLLAGADQSGLDDSAVVTNFENVDASGSTAAVNLVGDAGDNVLIGGLAADTIDGGAGDDRITYGGNDITVTGGADSDTLVVNTTIDLSVDLSVTADQVVTPDNGLTTGFENVDASGSTGAVTLTGDAGDNVLGGGANNDTIDGGSGGVDTARYVGPLAFGDVVWHAGSSVWTVSGGSEGTDTDTLTNIDYVAHAGGRFLLVGGGGFADINAAFAAATKPGDTIVFAEPPGAHEEVTITVVDSADHNVVLPYDADFHITVGDGNNTVVTGGGDDVIVTGDGDNVIHTGNGNDVVVTGTGHNVIVGGTGTGNDIYDATVDPANLTLEYPSAVNGITVLMTPADRWDVPTLASGGPPTIGELLDANVYDQHLPVGLVYGPDVDTDILISVRNVTGGPGNDTFVPDVGDNLDNVFDGADGTDTIDYSASVEALTVDLLGTGTATGTGIGSDTLSHFEVFKLGSGDDQFTGSTADETIDGGDGTGDTAVYSGDWIDYTISLSGSTYTITGSPDGTDQVTNVEQFTFANATGAASAIVNDTPTDIGLSSLTVAENAPNGTVVGSLTATDADTPLGDTVTFALLDNAGGLFSLDGTELEVANGVLLNYESQSSHTVHISVTDAHGATFDKYFVIAVADVNDVAPEITTNATQSVAEGATFVAALTSTDADTVGVPATFTISGGADAGLFTISDGTLLFQSARDFETQGHTYAVDVDAFDGAQTTTETITVTLTDLNDNAAVITTAASQSVAEGSTLVAALTSTDADTVGIPATFTISGGADAGLFTISDGNLLFQSARDFETQAHTYAVDVDAFDGAQTTTKTITVTLTDVNDGFPKFDSDATIGGESENSPTTNVVFSAHAHAIDGNGNPTDDTVTYALTGDDAALLAISTTGDVTFRTSPDHENAADADQNNVYRITVHATDSGNHVTSKDVIITVDNVSGNVINGTNAANIIDADNGAVRPTGEEDTINGLGGNDVLAGLGGADTLSGGLGTDTATYAASAFGVTVSLATGHGVGGDAQGDTLSGIENLTGSGSDDTLEGDDHDNVLIGGAGVDTVTYEHATAGVTVILSGGFSIGAGTDMLSGFENLTGSEHGDTLTGSGVANVLSGLGGDDLLIGGGGADHMLGGAGTDLLIGGGGADTLIGGLGNDTLIGGLGHDTFVFTSGFGKDVVTDFEAGAAVIDTISVDHGLFANFAAILAHTANSGADAVITLNANNSITLSHVHKADLHANDFIFT